ncbi:hypothetical protein HBH70_064230 [Parastagonospora nodorum]|nr:hypothetical protein HBI10_050210 [Parastagonospora nodorum]KAH4018445.1 hypothetical protein HBI13_132900 [Parastagonospora nodorum]KAH4072025.1 hypothetical protein HBH50_071700 [Parastagonospora nodorum]KAH4094909.1 hypothetical protein HBH48_059960 [Parastagonospora nodorum]KAH4207526.1 hypothetical protein HBI95_105190 [Parastagonospora nodorum]
MVVSRIEASPNNRAGCSNKECKDAGIKITKGEFRYAIQITINEHTSWQYRHWGCVTPKQIANLIESSGGDTDMVDGFDEVPAEYQEKVTFALENGHVPDEDWKGDVEVNRPGKNGFRVKATKKKAKKDDEDDDAEEKSNKKRSRKAKDADDDEDEAPAPKKARAKKVAKKEADDSEEEVIPAKKARGRKPAKQENADEEEKEVPAAKKPRVKKAAKKEDDEEAEAPVPAAKRGRPKKAAPVAEVEDEDVEEAEEAPKPKRGKKTAADGEVKATAKRHVMVLFRSLSTLTFPSRGRPKKTADE